MTRAATQVGPALLRRGPLSSLLILLYLATMPVYGALRLSGMAQRLGAVTVLTVVLLFGASMAHLAETRGMRRAAMMAGSACGIALGFELLGAQTGLLFGNYTYSDQLGPKVLGLVPLVIPIAWLMMLYPAYETAALLTGWALRTGCTRLLVRAPQALLAAAAMTAWDLSLDPRMVRDGNWTWHGGGPYFGIPLSNFAGWLVTSLLIYGVWQVLDRHRAPRDHGPGNLPAWCYIITWLAETVANLVVWGSPLVALAVFAGMGVFGAPALALLLDQRVRVFLATHKIVRRGWLVLVSLARDVYT